MRWPRGASKNDLLMQTQADLLQVPIVRPTVSETTALGAAYLAGLAVQYWESVEQIEKMWQTDRVFEPTISADESKSRIRRWHRAVQRSRSWANQDPEVDHE